MSNKIRFDIHNILIVDSFETGHNCCEKADLITEYIMKNYKSDVVKMTTIEKLNLKYFKYTGNSPDESFWSWLESMGIKPDEKSLRELLNDKDMWDEFKIYINKQQS